MKQKHKLALGASIVALASLGGIKAQAASVQEIINAAVPVANDYGLYPSVMIAQGILESSGGQSALASNYNNIFGVKYTSGTPVYLPTQEYLNGKMLLNPSKLIAQFMTHVLPKLKCYVLHHIILGLGVKIQVLT